MQKGEKDFLSEVYINAEENYQETISTQYEIKKKKYGKRNKTRPPKI